MEETEIKTATSPQICCCTTLRNVSGQLYSFTFSENNMLRQHLFHKFLFVYLFFLLDTNIIMTLLQYIV